MANNGKDKCEYLRNLRIKIAEANGIDYTPVECHHEGNCQGFCLACDAEMDYITRELEKKVEHREPVKLSGLLVDDTKLPNYTASADIMDDGEIDYSDFFDFQIPEEDGGSDKPDNRNLTGSSQSDRKKKNSKQKDIPYKLHVGSDSLNDDNYLRNGTLGFLVAMPIDEE